MAELTTTSHAILGLLARRDWTTYELAQQMQRRLHFVWPRAERKLYEEPRRLVAAGYATATKDMIGRRARTIYSITPAGREALRKWLSTPIDTPSFEFEGMVRVLFSDQSSREELRAMLRKIEEQATAERLRYEMISDAATPSRNATGHEENERKRLADLANRFVEGHFEHIGRWAREALAEVESWPEPSASAEPPHEATG
jgi:DNA-binding PadR family transcriptional regulator